MALDGALLRHIKNELEPLVLGGRVDKIHQPNRDELVVAIRTRSGLFRLLLSARANSARVGIITETLENPKQPPMLCMLFRKRLSGARLVEIRQPQLERALHFDFDAVNELGDHVLLTLTIEIMGKYSNIILSDQAGKVVDALKRVDAEMSSQRLVLPGVTYQLPPPQEKLYLPDTDFQTVWQKIQALPKAMELSKALLSVLQGLSPVVCRELAHQTGRGADLITREMDEEEIFRLGYFYRQLQETVAGASGKPVMVLDRQKKPLDFSFLEVQQYGTSAVTRSAESFSQLLDDFYRERDSQERMRVKSQDLLRLLSNHAERLSRKINHQQAELSASTDREKLRVAGDILSANLYSIPRGVDCVTLQNFYDETGGDIAIVLDPAKNPSQNAQKYYKDYRKAKTAEEKLRQQIILAEEELKYIDTVFEALAMARTEQDLAEIRAELAAEGYVRVLRSKKEKIPAISPPLSFQVDGDFTVLVGRNNRQNDKLTLKTANNNDIWFHTKNIPGSHTVLQTQGRQPGEKAMRQAAQLAAKHSRAKNAGAVVAVDYTQIRNVSKPQGAKPGAVIYVNFKTLFVNPDQEE